MNTLITLTRTASPTVGRSDGPAIATARPETCPSTPRRHNLQSEADRLFEARIQWFLAVSRAA